MKKIVVESVSIAVFVAYALLWSPLQGQAAQPTIADILISNNAENVLLYARCGDCFKTEIPMVLRSR